MDKLYQVAVIGAGPVGSAAAYFLAKAGQEVLLLDKASFPRDKTCGDGLTPRALNILREMGLLEEVNRLGYRINQLEIFGPGNKALEAPILAPAGWPAYSLIVPRLILDNLLVRWASSSGAEFQGQVAVHNLSQTKDRVRD